jgi:hypothetical protein
MKLACPDGEARSELEQWSNSMMRLIDIAAFSILALGLAPSAHAVPVTFEVEAALSGANENPANGSAGTGLAIVDVDTALHTMRVRITFADLAGPTTAAHIHCCTAPPGNVIVATLVPAFPGFPLGVTSGTSDSTLDLTSLLSYNPAFVTAHGGTAAGAEHDLVEGLFAGTAYLNIHSSAFGGGEIRGFLAVVPEPALVALFAFAAAAVAGTGARRRRSD